MDPHISYLAPYSLRHHSVRRNLWRHRHNISSGVLGLAGLHMHTVCMACTQQAETPLLYRRALYSNPPKHNGVPIYKYEYLPIPRIFPIETA